MSYASTNMYSVKQLFIARRVSTASPRLARGRVIPGSNAGREPAVLKSSYTAEYFRVSIRTAAPGRERVPD